MSLTTSVKPRRRSLTLQSLWHPDHVNTMDAKEFLFLASVSASAATYRIPMKSPSQYGFDIDMGDGRVERVTPADIPFTRAAFAILDQCGSEPGKFESFMWRYMAMSQLIQDKQMGRWTRPCDDTGFLLHSAVLRAAATQPLNRQGRFTKKPFFSTVKTIADSGVCDAD